MFSLVLKIAFIIFATGSRVLAQDPNKEAVAQGTQNRPDEESYTVIQARVSSLEAKVRSGEVEIQKLIQEKQHTKDPEKLNEVIRHMITIHKEMRNNIKEYDQQRSLLKYRYPERGVSDKREYERLHLKSLEEMESQISLGSSLNQTMKKVRSQYPMDSDIDSTKKEDLKKEISNHMENKRVPAAHKPGFADPIILKK